VLKGTFKGSETGPLKRERAPSLLNGKYAKGKIAYPECKGGEGFGGKC